MNLVRVVDGTLWLWLWCLCIILALWSGFSVFGRVVGGICILFG